MVAWCPLEQQERLVARVQGDCLSVGEVQMGARREDLLLLRESAIQMDGRKV